MVQRLTPLLCLAGLALAAFASPARASSEAADATWSEVRIPAAQQLDIRAAKTGHRYRIFMSVPPSPAPATGYPVLYVLDANAAFPVAAFMARSAASRSEVTGHVAPLVVGIGYPGEQDFDVPARKRDYTVSLGKPDAKATEGGADLFLDFIEKELKPLVASRHPVDGKRQALFGHSFGGLFVVHALLTRPEAFSTLIASSPSIWWDDKVVLKNLPKLDKLPEGVHPRVQVSVGALEDDPPKGKLPPEVLAMLAKRTMIPEARQLAAHLRQIAGWQDRVTYHELAGENHGPVWLPAMSRGMQFFLEQP